MMRFTVKNANKIITVSEFSKSELIKYYKNCAHKIEIVYNGVSATFIATKAKSPIVSGQYILTVGTISERKQQLRIIETFLKYENQNKTLVIAGSKNEEIFETNPEVSKKIDQSERVKFIDNPTDEVLSNLYQYAKYSIYYSSYEGFGIPIIESLLFGTPVIVSDIKVFRELFEGYVCFSKSDNIEHLYASIKEIDENLEKWSKKASKFKENNLYSFTLSAEKILQLTKNLK